MSAEVIHGDCLDVMAGMAEASVDSIVTDPPYGLEFMGKEWDKFPLRDRGERLTGSGNPTAARGFGGNVAYGKSAIALRQFGEWSFDWATAALRVIKPAGYMVAFGGTRTHHRLMCAIEDAGFEIRDVIMWIFGSGFPKAKSCLKPAYEPIILARKPGPRVLPLGIDACRTEYQSDADRASATPQGKCTAKSGALAGGTQHDGERGEFERPEMLGRWPANLVHDGSEEVLAGFPSEAGATGKVTVRNADKFRNTFGDFAGSDEDAPFYGDTGTAARFYYCAKASKADRGEGCTHPTVKPTALMRWLCRLVTPPGGLILDPFTGSGSTGKAALLEGFRFIGIEREAAYVEIARQRIAAACPPAEANLFA